ncbi:hypothetical protein [Lachnospira multipara]|uniref:hypothetical protein n=1 Tax=Lachnospira multipara TaxID=28051 RepID=UPI0004091DEC|nr:hypothetical protein [Lachnospira multipara]
MQHYTINYKELRSDLIKKNIKFNGKNYEYPFIPNSALINKKSIIGYMQESNSKKTGDNYLKLDNSTSCAEIPIFNKKPIFNKIIGYIPLGSDGLVAITSVRKIVPIVAILLLILFLSPAATMTVNALRNYISQHPNIIISNTQDETLPNDNLDIVGNSNDVDLAENTFDYSEQQTASQSTPSVIIDGITYEGEYLEVRQSDYIPFGNNEDNIGYQLQFIVKENNNVIYKSGRISSGNCIHWIPSQYLSTGLHNLDIEVEVFVAGNSSNTGVNANMPISIFIN